MKFQPTLLYISQLLILCACNIHTVSGEQDPQKTAPQNNVQQKVIYGNDDRQDVYQVTNLAIRKLAKSTVALVDQSQIQVTNGAFEILTNTFGANYNLCPNEPFYNQPAAAFCSGSLIGKDIILTAGHCIETQRDCSQVKFVFDFAYTDRNSVPQEGLVSDIYGCKEIIHSEVNRISGSDFALIRLDRPVRGRTPLNVRSSGTVGDNADLFVVGHPSGLPTKVAGGASVRNNLNGAFFVANLDTYGGNSGSSVFNQKTNQVEGVLVRGAADFVFANGCRKSNKCDNNGCRGEDVTRVERIFDYIAPSDL